MWSRPFGRFIQKPDNHVHHTAAELFVMHYVPEPTGVRRFEHRAVSNEEEFMRKIAIGLLAGAGALLTGSANASDIYATSEYSNSDRIQQVRMVCDEDGRCYRTRGGSRVIVRDSYAYAPRERYIERRHYHRDWDDGPRSGVGIRAPGVSVGVGIDSNRW
jgi:hypothetical protein